MADLLPIHKVGVGEDLQYFRTSDVYGTTGGLGARVGITKVADAALTGKETIVPVKEVLRTADLFRISIRYKTAAGKKKSGKLLVARDSMSKIFGTVAGDKLEGLPYTINGGASKGNITSVGSIRRATTY
jgi:hypothetical protein